MTSRNERWKGGQFQRMDDQFNIHHGHFVENYRSLGLRKRTSMELVSVFYLCGTWFHKTKLFLHRVCVYTCVFVYMCLSYMCHNMCVEVRGARAAVTSSLLPCGFLDLIRSSGFAEPSPAEAA